MIAAASVDVEAYGPPDCMLSSMLRDLTDRAVHELRCAKAVADCDLSAYVWLQTDRYSDEFALALVVGDTEYAHEMTPDLATRVHLPGVDSSSTASEYLASAAWSERVVENRLFHRALMVGSTRHY